MKKFSVLALGVITIVFIFIFYVPNRYNEIFTFNPIKNFMKREVSVHGLKEAVIIFSVLAPLQEEFVYRGPVWMFCFISFLLGVKDHWQKVIALLILFVPTLVWAMSHNYPPLYQGCVFLGGITSGLFIIYLMEKKHGWWITLFLPILLHGLFNLFFILIIWKFLL